MVRVFQGQEQFLGDPARALVRYVDKHSPNARFMLLSLVPGLVKKCVFYASTLEIMSNNVTYVALELREKGYPSAWWRGRFLNTLRLEGFKANPIHGDSLALARWGNHSCTIWGDEKGGLPLL